MRFNYLLCRGSRLPDLVVQVFPAVSDSFNPLYQAGLVGFISLFPAGLDGFISVSRGDGWFDFSVFPVVLALLSPWQIPVQSINNLSKLN